MANSVDPDQTPRSVASDLGVHCFAKAYLSQYFRVITVYSVCMGINYLICETSQWKAYHQKHLMEQSKRLSGDLKPELKKTTNKTKLESILISASMFRSSG